MTPRPSSRHKATAAPSRLLPFSIAGAVCFLLSFILGFGAWYFFGTRRRTAQDIKPTLVQTPVATPKPLESPTPRPSPATPRKPAPAGELPVPGGEIALGGEGTDDPLRREFVAPFAIAETETTNEQYQVFVKATGHKAPAHWRRGEFLPGTGTEPVTGVSWQDATDYCQWLSEQLGATVRLPTEAEWEKAARGEENYKYPWGNEWNDRAAVSKESMGQVRPVKSFAEGKAQCGAYDMAGNVWEWVSDQARDKDGKVREGWRLIKGGSALETRAFISATSRYPAVADSSSRTLGFRYVLVRKDAPAISNGQ